MISFVKGLLKLERAILCNAKTYAPIDYNGAISLNTTKGKLLYIDRIIKEEVDFYYKNVH